MYKKKSLALTSFVLFFFTICHSLFSQDYAVLGIGAPTVDLLFYTSDAFLDSFQIEKGGSKHADWETFSRLISQAGSPSYAAGGCCSNTLKGMSLLGHKAAICGKLGKDVAAEKYLENIQSFGVLPKTLVSLSPTQQVAAFITPDRQRTFCVYPGAGLELTGEDLTKELFQGVKLVHIEGYALHNGNLVSQAIRMAKEAGALVSFDACSFELASSYKEFLLKEVAPYIDIFFANETETYALTGLDPEKGCEELRNVYKVVAVKGGDKGCWIGANGKTERFPAFFVGQVVDTTGAGDLFASGFLHAYLEGLPIEACAYCGNLLGSAVIQYLGAEIPLTHWQELHRKIQFNNALEQK